MEILEFLENFWEIANPWLMTSGLKIVGILFLIFLVNRFGRNFFEKIIGRAVKSNRYVSEEAEKKREETLIRIFYSTSRIIVWIVGLLMIISEIGINISPVIAAAGILGIAVGFGGQYLVKDVISGLFIILENQYRVGDIVSLEKVLGMVEDINLRITIIRDMDGTIHYIPNGEIRKTSNFSKDFAKINLEMAIDSSSDLKKVKEIVNRIGEEISTEEKFKNLIIKPLQFLRIEEFGDSRVIIKIIGEVKPKRQWEISGEFRERIKLAFDKQGIVIMKVK
jgi:small conductance mechanosensitive channel